MPSASPPVSTSTVILLEALGRRLQLARLRRKLSVTETARRAGISRSTFYEIERGNVSVTIGAYMEALNALGLEDSVGLVAKDDPEGRALQDDELDPRVPAKRAKARPRARPVGHQED